MKSLISFAGWVAFLVAVGAGLLFYNLGYLPLGTRLARQQEETGMWTREVESLRRQLDEKETEPETLFSAIFTWDELFRTPESFEITSGGEAALKGCITMLQGAAGTVEVTGHTSTGPVPDGLADRYPTGWEFAAAKAGAVVRSLQGWGIQSERLELTSAGSTRPRDSNETTDGRARNQRVEILVRK